jgi:hypothetical protein
VTVAVADPQRTASLWGEILGVASENETSPRLSLDGSEVRFEVPAPGRRESLVEIALELPGQFPGGTDELELAGVRLRRL